MREAAKRGAQVVLPSELFQGIYFCTQAGPEVVRHRACRWASIRACWRCRSSPAELKVVIPISFFEKDGPRYYNSVAIADADGNILGVYRKSHIPDGPGYQEKYYFRPGDTGFKAWKTKAGTIGVGICWDQWFPECARAMALAGAEVLFYPTAIGSEPYDASARHAPAVAAGHAGARGRRTPCRSSPPTASGWRTTTAPSRNSTATRSSPTIAARSSRASAPPRKACWCTPSISTEIESYRADWGFFRDRRADLYAKSIV